MCGLEFGSAISAHDRARAIRQVAGRSELLPHLFNPKTRLCGRVGRKRAEVGLANRRDLKIPAGTIANVADHHQRCRAALEMGPFLEIANDFDVSVGRQADLLAQLTQRGVDRRLVPRTPAAGEPPAGCVAKPD